LPGNEIPGPFSSRGKTGSGGRSRPDVPPGSRAITHPSSASTPTHVTRAGGTCPPPEGDPHPAPPERRTSGEALYPLLAAARGGHDAALADLASRVRALLVRSIAPRLAGGWAAAFAEDVVGDAMVDVLRGFAGCRAGCEGEFRAWIAAIARREIASFFRHEAGRHRLHVSLQSGLPLSAPFEEPDEDAGEPDASLTLDLSAAEWNLLRLRIDTSATWSEVGRELGIPATAAKRRYQRLLRRIRSRTHPDAARRRAQGPPR
jgi:RNA polymerase sigma factor (sigma-70 family)